MKIGVTDEIREKCTRDGVFDFEKAKRMVHDERIKTIKTSQEMPER